MRGVSHSVLICAAATVWLAAAAAGPAVKASDPPAATPAAAPAPSADRRAAGSSERRTVAGNLVGHGGPVKAIRVSADGTRALTGSFDYSVMLWDVSDPQQPRLLRRFDDHGSAVNAVAFVPGSPLLLAAGDDGSLSSWHAETGRLQHRALAHTGKLLGLAVSPDGRRAATASWDRTARVWDIDTLTPGPALKGQLGPINAVAFSADGRTLYAASYDGTIALFDIATGEFKGPVYKHGWGINVLERLPPDTAAATGDRLLFGALNGAVAVLDVAAGQLVRELAGHDRPVLALAALPAFGLVASGGGDGAIHVWRTGDWQRLESYRNPYGPVWALALQVDGEALYYGGLDDFAARWSIAPRAPFEQVPVDFPRRFQVGRSPSGGAADSTDPRQAVLAEGELQFARKCSVCHTLGADGGNRAGPSLHNVFGRRAGTLPGYSYSDALRGIPIVWDADTIGRLFELGPDVLTPGSKMPLQKMTDASQRRALIEYLQVATSEAAAAPAEPDPQLRTNATREQRR